MNSISVKRMNINLFLLGSVLCIGELHQLFDTPNYNLKPFLLRPHFVFTLGTGWYVKLLTWFVQDVIKAVVILRLSRLHTRMRIAARAYLYMTILGFLIYVLVYSGVSYFVSIVYPAFGIIMMLAVLVDERGGVSLNPFQKERNQKLVHVYRKWHRKALERIKRLRRTVRPHSQPLDLTELIYHQ